jgi:PDZ domain-containing protein
VGAVQRRVQPRQRRRPVGRPDVQPGRRRQAHTGDLNGSKFIAGTGTIGPDGNVGPIGGIAHKMSSAQEAGATVFLVPAENCDEARTAPDNSMELVKAENLTQTIDALHTLTSGGNPPRC